MIKTKRQILSALLKEIKYSTDNKKFRKSLKNAQKSGIDINSKLYRGRTLLHYAVKRNNKCFRTNETRTR